MKLCVRLLGIILFSFTGPMAGAEESYFDWVTTLFQRSCPEDASEWEEKRRKSIESLLYISVDDMDIRRRASRQVDYLNWPFSKMADSKQL